MHCMFVDFSFFDNVCNAGFLLSKVVVPGYSKTCLKWPLSKRPKMGFQDQLLLNAGQKYCRMLQREHSAILSTFIKLTFVIKFFDLSICEWPLKTGFTVYLKKVIPNTSYILIRHLQDNFWGQFSAEFFPLSYLFHHDSVDNFWRVISNMYYFGKGSIQAKNDSYLYVKFQFSISINC